jgi:hypothetical protein
MSNIPYFYIRIKYKCDLSIYLWASRFLVYWNTLTTFSARHSVGITPIVGNAV